MPNKDLHHELVVRMLIDSGWTILNEQYYLSVGSHPDDVKRLYIDLRAINESQQIIFVEVKGMRPSPVHSLMELLGQFLVYQAGLQLLGDTTPIYIAISVSDYENVIQHVLAQTLLQKNPINFMIYDPVQEEIVKWMPQP